MLELFANNCGFKIDNASSAWCKCWLDINGSVNYLGAETLVYLKNHLLIGLSDERKESSGYINGYEVAWVLSLSEVHTVLYVIINQKTKTLIFQNGDNPLIQPYVIELSQTQSLDWAYAIKEI